MRSHACWICCESVVRPQMARRRTKRPSSLQGTRWIALLLLILSNNFSFSSLEPCKEVAEEKNSTTDRLCLAYLSFGLYVQTLFMLQFIMFANYLREPCSAVECIISSVQDPAGTFLYNRDDLHTLATTKLTSPVTDFSSTCLFSQNVCFLFFFLLLL